MIKTISEKMRDDGSIQILTDIPKESDLYKSMYDEIIANGFTDCTDVPSEYLARLKMDSLSYFSNPYVLSFCRK